MKCFTLKVEAMDYYTPLMRTMGISFTSFDALTRQEVVAFFGKMLQWILQPSGCMQPVMALFIVYQL
jgi:hypothetical protein